MNAITTTEIYLQAGNLTEEPSAGAELYALRLSAGAGDDQVLLELPLGTVEPAAIIVNGTQLELSAAAMDHLRDLLELARMLQAAGTVA